MLLDDICHLEEPTCAEKLLLMRAPDSGYNLVFWFTSSCQPKQKQKTKKQKKTGDLTNPMQHVRDSHLQSRTLAEHFNLV